MSPPTRSTPSRLSGSTRHPVAELIELIGGLPGAERVLRRSTVDRYDAELRDVDPGAADGQGSRVAAAAEGASLGSVVECRLSMRVRRQRFDRPESVHGVR